MAVFPDRIVLKTSTDTDSSIVSQIGSSGTDPIQPGELVIGRSAGSIILYSLDSTGAVKKIGQTNLSTTSIDALSDVNTTSVAPQIKQTLVWNGTNWVPGDAAASVGRGDGGDFTSGTVDAGFAFGVYGGGDFTAGTNDLPVEMSDGPDAGVFT
jgi:hypothetical protein